MYSNEGWTEYMAAIFKFLHGIGITKDEILACMNEIPLTEGMDKLFELLSSDVYDVIIISDSNSVFIECIMKSFHYEKNVDRVFTNPAQFHETGCLTLEPYHDQDWCNLSTRNLCKGHILQEYMADQKSKGVNYSIVCYVGDGSNDLCPGLKLQKKDYLFPRIGYRLNKLLQKDSDVGVQAQVVPWSTGQEIIDVLSAI